MASCAAVPITKLPPGSERFDLKFQPHIAGRAKYPVSAEFDGEGFQSPGLAYEDYQRMATFGRKLAPGRRYETPEWALNNELLQAVLAAYMESRAFMRWVRHCERGNEKERIQRAQQVIVIRQDPVQKNTLARLCREYVELKHSGALSDDEQRRKRLLECEIEGLDTTLRTNARIAALVAAIAYLYFRRGLNSVEVAEELNLKPPHIRQVLWRLQRSWERMGGERPKKITGIGRRYTHWAKPDHRCRVIRIEHFSEPKPAPVESPTPYEKYRSYCASVAVPPMKEVEWQVMYGSNSLFLKYNDCVSSAAIHASCLIDLGMARRAYAEMRKPL